MGALEYPCTLRALTEAVPAPGWAPLFADVAGLPPVVPPPYKGGWAGNDVFPDVLSAEQRARARVLTQNLGDRLGSEGYPPESGIWESGARGKLKFVRAATDWHDLSATEEGFYLRIAGPGDYLYKGADIGILVTRARLQSDAYRLTPLCKRWVNGLRTRVTATPLDQLPPGVSPAAVKG